MLNDLKTTEQCHTDRDHDVSRKPDDEKKTQIELGVPVLTPHCLHQSGNGCYQMFLMAIISAQWVIPLTQSPHPYKGKQNQLRTSVITEHTATDSLRLSSWVHILRPAVRGDFESLNLVWVVYLKQSRKFL